MGRARSWSIAAGMACCGLGRLRLRRRRDRWVSTELEGTRGRRAGAWALDATASTLWGGRVIQTLMGRKGNVLAAQFSLMPSHKVITDCPTEVYVFGTPCSRCAAEVGDLCVEL
ncbi:hypothetical protein F442_07049 [Phytophthora nicotianae P10297]|uniref:Uncharacterized protein n=1 Tax=Phytophthora nicotianae P10297 TaxID=1317064 RepID=W2ZII7_PHYNI|nr:hypothetical protein F442_07049 [Phytophthora nicotianae P10297]